MMKFVCEVKLVNSKDIKDLNVHSGFKKHVHQMTMTDVVERCGNVF